MSFYFCYSTACQGGLTNCASCGSCTGGSCQACCMNGFYQWGPYFSQCVWGNLPTPPYILTCYGIPPAPTCTPYDPPPSVTIYFPTATTYTWNVSNLYWNASDSQYTDINVRGIASTKYSLDNGTTNVSFNCNGNFSCTFNITNLNSVEGQNYWTVWTTDKGGNTVKSGVGFTKNTASSNCWDFTNGMLHIPKSCGFFNLLVLLQTVFRG
jgi:hypothetical protein